MKRARNAAAKSVTLALPRGAPVALVGTLVLALPVVVLASQMMAAVSGS